LRGGEQVVDYSTVPNGKGARALTATVRWQGAERTIAGEGAGPVDAFVHALDKDLGLKVQVKDYHEHAVGQGSEAQAACYVAVAAKSGIVHGAAKDASVTMAALAAVASAVNRM
jgi:2-isopropylmalate synthase